MIDRNGLYWFKSLPNGTVEDRIKESFSFLNSESGEI